MSDDTQAARAAFEAWAKPKLAIATYGDDTTYISYETRSAWSAWIACWDASRSIPAAAALLRAPGWTVEEPGSRDDPEWWN